MSIPKDKLPQPVLDMMVRALMRVEVESRFNHTDDVWEIPDDVVHEVGDVLAVMHEQVGAKA